MEIDWFTLLAEIANFFILLYLLRRFLYKPILRMADEREARIAARFAEAEAREVGAAEEAAAYERQRRALEDRREEFLDEARKAAQEERHLLLEQVREEVDKEHRSWQQQLAREREAFLHALQQRAGEEVYALSARVLADLAGADLHEQIVARFLTQLRQMPADEAEGLQQHFADGELEVASAFPLSAEQRRDIVATLEEMLEVADPPLTFREDEALIGGIALRIGGHKVAWNVRNYLDRLQERMEEALHEAFAGEAEAEPQQEESHG
jgi:F-type H+-transporting ATPase subunit b